jgi:prepilin-type N-terminal cleavage/methylation domain-containing protein
MKGFTLVETLITILIFALVMGAVSGLVVMAYRAQSYTWEQSIATDEARRGIETMIKEIREARPGDDGSFSIERADDKEFVFYSDIDKDGATERVRYFLGTVNEGVLSEKCYTNVTGGVCPPVTFSDFLTGTLLSAEVRVTVNGDFNYYDEYADIKADGPTLISDLCRAGCSQCPSSWQGLRTFDVTDQASDGIITFEADASSGVNHSCYWDGTVHKMKVNFEFSWTEEIMGTEFKKGVVNPVGDPAEYPLDQEEVTVLSSYVRNAPPIFEYYDADNQKIEEYPSRLADTKLMRLLLVIDVDPEHSPPPYDLLSSVQLRNLKE